MNEDIPAIVNQFIAKHAGMPIEALSDPSIRLDSLSIDSIGVIELLFDIEEKYDGVHIDDPMQLKTLTLGQLHEMVIELIERKESEASMQVDVSEVAKAEV